jgi:predicted membrane GTPase involved in stress response
LNRSISAGAGRWVSRRRFVAVHGQHIESAELDFLVVLAGMQRIEIGDAINALDDRLAVDLKLA